MKPISRFLHTVLLVGVLQSTVHPVMAEMPAPLLEKLRSPAPNLEAAVLFSSTADVNEGSGDARWVATSGTRLSARGQGPWGDEEGAFGPPETAAGGAAIASSIESTLLTGDAGALILCVLIPEVTGDPAMILSRGAWGDRFTFDLRADKMRNIILYSGKSDEKPGALNLAAFKPETWVFIGMSWHRQNDEILLETFIGELSEGETPESRSFPIAQAGEIRAPILIAGRTNPELTPALLQGGLFCGLAIYEASLSQETMEGLFKAFTSVAKP